MNGTLTGKVAVVTGAGTGLGRAIAQRFHEAGARVVAADISGEEETTAKALGEPATSISANVADAADVRRMIEFAVSTHGRLDVLCNNAGIDGPMAFTADLDEADFDRVISVNLRGVFLGLRYAIPAMLETGGGSIINISSIGGMIGAPMGAAYVASKHGVIGLTRTAALEYARQGIRVNAICPGAMDTQMFQSLPAEIADQVMGMQPIGRVGCPEEVAAAALFLASDESTFTTGAAWAVDGGFTAQ